MKTKPRGENYSSSQQLLPTQKKVTQNKKGPLLLKRLTSTTIRYVSRERQTYMEIEKKIERLRKIWG